MKFKYIIYVLLVAISLICLSVFSPIKYAVKQGNLNKADDYLIVKVQKSTISEWIAIGDNKCIYDDAKNVRLTGNIPSGYDYNIETGGNIFICYGKVEGTSDLHGEKYYIYNVENWEILYPVKRNSCFEKVLPDSYLCGFDIM